MVQPGSDDEANQKKFDISKSEVEKKRQEVYNALNKVDWNAFKVKTGLDLNGGAEKFNLKHADGYCSETGAVVRKCKAFELQWFKKCNQDKGEITKCSTYGNFKLLNDTLLKRLRHIPYMQ